MLGINNLTIGGNLVKDPYVRETASGEMVSFVVAINRRFFQNDVAKEYTHFIPVKAWGKSAQVCKKLRKGDAVCVLGELATFRPAAGEDAPATHTEVYVKVRQLFTSPKKDMAV